MTLTEEYLKKLNEMIFKYNRTLDVLGFIDGKMQKKLQKLILQIASDSYDSGRKKELNKIQDLYSEFDTDPKETLSIIAEHVEISLNAKGSHSIDVNGNCNHGCC